MAPRRPIVASAIVGVALLALAVAPASAGYPGEANGRIVVSTRSGTGDFSIWTMKPNGAGRIALTSGPGKNLCPAYSADGQRIVFCRSTSGPWEIWTMKANGTQATQLTHFGGFAIFPDFSPDGTKVAFSGVIGDSGNDQVFVVDATTGALISQLTTCDVAHPDCFSDYPAWSPDGTRIAFVHGDGFDADGNNINEQVWVMDANGAFAHAITSGPDPKDQVPDWSPDGTRIVYASGPFGAEGIWTMDADGANKVQLTGCTAPVAVPCPLGDDWGPAWSPDGMKIAFLRDLTSLDTPDRPIFVMNVDGTGQVRITPEVALHGTPEWQPRGVGAGD